MMRLQYNQLAAPVSAIILIACFFLWGCSDDPTQPEPTRVLSVTPDNRDVPSSAGSTTFSVANNGDGTMSWTAIYDASWVTLSGASGTNSGTITANYTANNGDSRVCTITVTANDATGSPKQVTITQEGGTPVLSVDPDNRTVSSSAGLTTFDVSNDGGGTMDWSATDDASWVTLSGASGTNSGTITANYDANPNPSPRECTITVTAPGATGSPKQVTISQEAYQPCPNAPSNPTPADGNEDVGTQSVVLSWDGGDPDGGDVTYQVHFGTFDPPPLLDEVINQTSYELSTQLYNNEVYYWRIDAIDDDSPPCETPGEVWSFETSATTSVTIFPDDNDTFADCDNAEDNWCNSNNLYIGDGSDCYTTYLHFDFSEIPNGAVIPDGGWKIYLWQWQVFGPVSSGDDYALFRNDDNWSECSLTYNNRPDRDNYDAHFQDVVDEENLWICLWDPDGLNFTDVVRDMISGARPNYGFQVQCDVGRGTWLTFRSTNNPGRDEDPYMEVNYTWSP